MKYHFFLGGKDLEMNEVRLALVAASIAFSDKALGWGAHASAYSAEIANVAARGETPVLVELDNASHAATQWDAAKEPVAMPAGTIEVDHHGARAGEPASVLQVLTLIGATPTRWHKLVAADDGNGGPVGLVAFGATPEEFAAVRAAGRAVQGITPEQEAEADRAVAGAEKFGKLVVVRCTHSKCGPITDRLFPNWQDGKENVLVIASDGEMDYFGDAHVRNALEQKFGGWKGGDPAGNGFWGANGIDQSEVLALVKSLAA